MAVPESQMGITIAFSILIPIGIIGNVFVILAILLNKTLHTPMNWLLVNLAVADIFVGLFQAFRFIFFFFIDHREDFGSKMLCTFLTGGTFTWVGCLTSGYTLVVIAVERFYAVLHPHKSRQRMSSTKIKIIVPILWTLSCVFVLPLFLTRRYIEMRHFCGEDWPSRPVAQTYAVGWIIFGAVLPSVIMTVLYARIVHSFWSNRNIQVSTQQARMTARKKLTEIVIVVTVIYIICLNPVMVIYTLAQFGPTFVGSTAQRIGIFLVTLNSTVNPVLYTFHSKAFRTHLIAIIMCRAQWCRNRNRIHPTSSTSERDGRTTKQTTNGRGMDSGISAERSDAEVHSTSVRHDLFD